MNKGEIDRVYTQEHNAQPDSGDNFYSVGEHQERCNDLAFADADLSGDEAAQDGGEKKRPARFGGISG